MQRHASSEGVDISRVRLLKQGREVSGPVLYWMSRDQRSRDNWALLYAQELALSLGVPLGVVFCLAPAFLGATLRQYGFLLRGLEGTARALRTKGIPFFFLAGDPAKELPRFVRAQHISALVTDFDPLRIKQRWKESVAERITVPVFEVDAHNIVPCWIASRKREYGAYTLRPKLRKLLPQFLLDLPSLARHPNAWKGRAPVINWTRVRSGLRVDRKVPEVGWITPGEDAAHRALASFVRARLKSYDEQRNDPALDGQSGLSPYLHFGQLSAQRVALAVLRSKAPERAKEAFLEELITRRELSDNFCFFTPDYDAPTCFPDWAQRTLEAHRKDPRPYRYSLKELEAGRTHDPLWNAAQQNMVQRGKMHGYLRMYWAKKILEWTRSPWEAMEIAIHLNDRYELDGRDPNGYAGIAWSIGGVHDRPWGERSIFGMVRYMSEKGCRSKFDVDGYIRKVRDQGAGRRS
jgi:deoxyribodipyrimidine photo-lyase